MIADDLDLLARYARDGADDAFAALVRRHADLVYSVALRIVRSPQLAEEVSQTVFIELSRNAKRMNAAVILSAWLYRVARSKSVDALRCESRRQRREQVAAVLDASGPETPMVDLEPLLDDALDALTENDRAAIVMRFFEQKSLTDVGNALGVSDDAAQKRVSRAVEQLRAFFTKRGLVAGTAGVAAMLTANFAKAAPSSLAPGICTAVKASVSTLGTTSLISSIIMTTTQKVLTAAVIALAAGFTIYQVRNGQDGTRTGASGHGVSTSASQADPSHAQVAKAKGGPRALLKPRLDEAGKLHLQQDPGAVLSEHAAGEGEKWGRADDDLLVAWAAKDLESAMKWVNGGERGVVRAELIGAVAAGVLLHDGKDAMRSFLDKYQQDPDLRPKDQGELEKYLFYHLGREDTFDAAMAILGETRDSSKDAMRRFLDEHHLDPQLLPKDEMELEEYLHDQLGQEDTFDKAMDILADTTRANMMAGMMITGIDGAQGKTSAIDYMEANGIPVDFNYWSMQEDISKDPRYWADWARQRDSGLLAEIVDGWARSHPDEAKAWVGENVPKDDKRRADIDELLQIRDNPPAMESTDTDEPDTDEPE